MILAGVTVAFIFTYMAQAPMLSELICTERTIKFTINMIQAAEISYEMVFHVAYLKIISAPSRIDKFVPVLNRAQRHYNIQYR
jgi:hypothetical protein